MLVSVDECWLVLMLLLACAVLMMLPRAVLVMQVKQPILEEQFHFNKQRFLQTSPIWKGTASKLAASKLAAGYLAIPPSGAQRPSHYGTQLCYQINQNPKADPTIMLAPENLHHPNHHC
jgi:hypothetical protein